MSNKEIKVISKKELDEKLTEDSFIARAILELVGKPKDHVEMTLFNYVKDLANNDKYDLIEYELHDAELVENSENLYSTFAEVEFLSKNSSDLMNFCIDYMPASVEVLEPESLKVTATYFSDLLTELVGRLHLIDGEFKKVVAKNNVLAQSLQAMVNNAILVSLTTGPKKIEEISKQMGIEEKQMSELLDKLLKEKKIAVKDNIYSSVESKK